MTTLKELAAMLNAATGPSRDVDAAIAKAFDMVPPANDGTMEMTATHYGDGLLGYQKLGDPRTSDDAYYLILCKRYTSSIDAALALVERLLPGGMSTYCEQWLDIKLGSVWTWELTEHVLDLSRCETAPTAPLAILKALVAALIAKENTDEA